MAVTMVQGVVIDTLPPGSTDGYLIGQIFVSSSKLYFADDSVKYIGNSAFVFNKADFPELWAIFKDGDEVDTGRVPQIDDLNEFDKFFVKVTAVGSIINAGV